MPAIFGVLAGVIAVAEIALDIRAGIVFDHGTLPFLILLPSCLGGLGWFAARHWLIGGLMLALRVFYVAMVLATALVMAGAANWTTGLLIWCVLVAGLGVLMPILSAAVLSLVLRQS